MGGRLVGVGVGPGDPDLLTVRGRDVLRAADALFVPVAGDDGAGDDGDDGIGDDGIGDDERGYAERVVRAHVPHATPIRRLVFSVAADPDARAASWERAAGRVAGALRGGATVAFATIGDPNVYSTFTHLSREVAARVPDVRLETVPGVTAMQDLAARSGTVLARRDEGLALLPLTAGDDALRAALAVWDTVVLYKGGSRLPAVWRLVAGAGRLDEAVFGARLGLDGEDVRDHLPDAPSPYLSTVIVRRGRGDTGRAGPDSGTGGDPGAGGDP